MGDTRRISVVIPAFNAQPFLAETIASVTAQTWSDWELLLVDDGSRDATVEIASEQARQDRRISVHRQENQGVAAARNRGAAQVAQESRYVLFLDHDDVLEPDALATLHAVLDGGSQGAVAAYGLARDIDPAGVLLTSRLEDAYAYERESLSETAPPRPMAPDEPDTFANLVAWPSISTPCQVLIRADALRRAGPFDPAVVPSDDWDMWIRLSLQGPLRRVVRFTARQRQHPASLYHNRSALRSAEPALRLKLASSPLLSPDQKKLARIAQRYAALRRLRWSREHLAEGDWRGAARSIVQALRSYAIYWRTQY